MEGFDNFTDADARATMLRAIRLLAIMAAIAAALVLWKLGWRSAVLLLVGAAISASGLWEWTKLMAAVMTRMESGAKGRPMGLVLTGFFLRLGLSVAVLYVSLKFLNGSVIALAVGLGMGVIALTFEAIKLVRTWTV
jgi:hypothetical protein